jgi:hypothetical protein
MIFQTVNLVIKKRAGAVKSLLDTHSLMDYDDFVP